MSRNWVFVLPVALLLGGGYWIGTESDRKSRQIDADAAAYSHALEIEAQKETERLRPIIEAEQRRTDAALKSIQDYIEKNPAKTQEIFDRLDAKSAGKIDAAENEATSRDTQSEPDKESERRRIAELKASFANLQQQIDDRVKAAEQYVEAVANAEKRAEAIAAQSRQKITDAIQRANENRRNRDRMSGNNSETIINPFYRRGE
jgi:hypothetical protein